MLKSRWGKDTDFEGEFTYVPGYWEWAEDALNFFNKPLKDVMLYDVVYVSLFTYDRNINVVQEFCEMLGGLPLSGEIYDKHIPNTLDLAKGSHKCCVWLFEAFYYLNQQEDDTTYVQASRWIAFLCRKTQKYATPPQRKENKKSRPKATHNPSGILEASRWPHFVLSGEPTATIHLETFKMACKIAKGNKVCLALPVLASIYYGLNSISESVSLGQMGTPFPIHYVYGWLSAYFQTHFKTPCLVSSHPKMVISSREGGAKHYDKMDAHKRIFKGECVSWLCTSLVNGDPIVPVNEGIIQEQRDELDTLRKGKTPVQDAPHDQASGHTTQKRREEQVRQRSSDEDADSDHNFKRNRKMSSNENPFMSKYMVFIASLWNDICEKLRETPVESVSSFKGSVAKQLHFMKRDGVDLSSLKDRVDELFKKAEDYDKIWSQPSETIPVEAQVMELCIAQGVLKDAQQKLSETQTLLSEQQKILVMDK
nr:ABC transporter G family member 11 [Ipomoea batatas]